jgi:hypothetical protein
MQDKSDTLPSLVKMVRARQLMEQGHYQESLSLALDALFQELNNLRDSLMALRILAQSESRASALKARTEEPGSAPYWLPPNKPRILH